ncbi:nucleotide exchange factor GrpE [Kribbella sp. ALI-6-A]|uniref:nucleotide exchange factor GrpE n=1 Tax=Kribbella sp. ALI-6-A TaxID=1933817 RepID=UPI00097BEDB3|nr:nucleotide exchange factor GrpE [Kribbella sp. ALI-6-A]ONI68099.1 nucleotide exchange factor GrpE [Kribbella sp. ALI-6-A]
MTDRPTDPGSEFGDGEPVVRDKRRIDPETGNLRESGEATSSAPAGGAAPGMPGTPGAQPPRDPSDLVGPSAQEALLTEALAERTADLQRLQAEYVNYKRRVDRDREANREQVIGSVLTELLQTLDDIGRAREAGELEGAFKAVAESVERVTEKLGLVKYGEVGDPFDPRIHEALLHNYSDEVDGPTATLVMQPGYRLGDRILRAARVAVSEPTEQLPAGAENGAEGNDDDNQAADKPAE